MAIFAITQARLGSERLPGKVLKPINGLPLIAYHLTRLNNISGIDRVVVATPDNPDNSVLHNFLLDYDHDYVTGSEADVLARFQLATKALAGKPDDLVLRVTADCPLLCPELISALLNAYESANVDYMRLDTNYCARGFDAELFSVAMLNDAAENTESGYDREHVTPYFYEPGSKYTTAEFRPEAPASNQYRLCVDEPDDFRLIEAIVQAHPDNWQQLTYDNIIEFLDKNPEIARLNQAVIQRNS